MAENWRVAWKRRIAGVPLLGRAPVAQEGVVNMPDRLRYSDFGMGSTVTVVMFPGDPPMVADHFVSGLLRAAPRQRRRGGAEFRVPSPAVPQTVSNLRRDQLAGLGAVPEAKLDIFEGTV